MDNLYKKLKTIPIDKLFLCNNFDLTPYGINAYCTTINIYTIRICLNGINKVAINVDIPTYEINHPEKYEATKFSIFNVFEYTKRESYSTTEINWNLFKSKFISACLDLIKY